MFYYPLTVFDIKEEAEQRPEQEQANELRNKRGNFKVIQEQQNTGILKFVKQNNENSSESVTLSHNQFIRPNA